MSGHHASRRRSNYRAEHKPAAPAAPPVASSAPKQRISDELCPGAKARVEHAAVFAGPRGLLQAACPACGRAVFVDMHEKWARVLNHGAPLPDEQEAAG